MIINVTSSPIEEELQFYIEIYTSFNEISTNEWPFTLYQYYVEDG